MVNALARRDNNEVPNVMGLTANKELRNILVADSGALVSQSSDFLIEDSTVINRNPDGSIASAVIAYGTNTRTETINRNPDGSIQSVSVVVA